MSAEEMEALNKQVDSEVTVQGGRSKPTMNDILVFQIVLLPWVLGKVHVYTSSYLTCTGPKIIHTSLGSCS